MTNRLLFIVNPIAGKGQIRSRLMAVLDLFTKYGYEVTIRITQSEGDAQKTAEKFAHEYDLVVCSGGDGTLSEIVNGLMRIKGPRPKVAYIPTGTTNDFASTLGLPTTDTLAAAELAITGNALACDVGKFNNKYFTYSAAFGAFTDVAYATPQKSKSILGRAAYVLQGVERLSSLRSYRLTIKTEHEHIEDDFIFGMITNSDSIAGFKGLAGTGVELSDGLFEVALIRMPRTILDLQQLVVALLSHEVSVQGVYSFKGSKISIDGVEPLAWTLDGEFGGAPSRSEIDVMPGAIRYVTMRSQLTK